MRIIKQSNENNWLQENVGLNQKANIFPRIIRKDVFEAKALAQKLKEDAQADLARREKAAEIHADALREEEAFRTKLEYLDLQAQEILMASFALKEKYAQARADIQALAIAIAEKVLGGSLQMSKEAREKFILRFLDANLEKIELKILCALGRLKNIEGRVSESLYGHDFLVEEALEIDPGFIRIISIFGEIICRENTIFSLPKKINYEI